MNPNAVEVCAGGVIVFIGLELCLFFGAIIYNLIGQWHEYQEHSKEKRKRR